MATKSILKNVDINNSNMGQLFLSALDNSEINKKTPNKPKKEYNDLKGPDIKSFFTK